MDALALAETVEGTAQVAKAILDGKAQLTCANQVKSRNSERGAIEDIRSRSTISEVV
jgi:hypothetical protein